MRDKREEKRIKAEKIDALRWDRMGVALPRVGFPHAANGTPLTRVYSKVQNGSGSTTAHSKRCRDKMFVQGTSRHLQDSLRSKCGQPHHPANRWRPQCRRCPTISSRCPRRATSAPSTGCSGSSCLPLGPVRCEEVRASRATVTYCHVRPLATSIDGATQRGRQPGMLYKAKAAMPCRRRRKKNLRTLLVGTLSVTGTKKGTGIIVIRRGHTSSHMHNVLLYSRSRHQVFDIGSKLSSPACALLQIF